MPNIVYLLSNPAMPGLVKIGYTNQEDANSRIAQLYTTGVPVPFEIKFVCRVENAEEVEKALHLAFGPNRINSKREFFRIEPEQVIAILKLLHKEDITSEVTRQPSGLDKESVIAAENLKARRPNLNFEEMGIPIGSELESVNDESKAFVSSSKKVKLNNEEMSLTAATRKVLGIDYNVQPGPHWTFNGKTIQEVYNDTYDFE